jgi:hypothetical protein
VSRAEDVRTMIPSMPSAVHERVTTPVADGHNPPPRRPRQELVLAWGDAVLRKLLRAYLAQTVRPRRRIQRGHVDPYSTAPVRLSPGESDRVEEILSRRLAT